MIVNRQEKFADVLLYDVHGEYTQMFHSPKPWMEGEDWVRTFTVIDFDFVTDSELFTFDASNFVEAYGGYVDPIFGTVYHVCGSRVGHLRLFNEFADELNEGPQGGDDDTFDYWPNTMDMLEVYAHDLTELYEDRHFYNRLAHIASMNEDVPEWAETAERLITLTNEYNAKG